MKRLYLILGDQLHPDPHPLLVDGDPARDELLMVNGSNAVEQMSGRHQVGLSAQVVKTADQMLGTLIDLKA